MKSWSWPVLVRVVGEGVRGPPRLCWCRGTGTGGQAGVGGAQSPGASGLTAPGSSRDRATREPFSRSSSGPFSVSWEPALCSSQFLILFSPEMGSSGGSAMLSFLSFACPAAGLVQG